VESLITGILMGLSLIVAIGSQNIWVLSQSMVNPHRVTIALTCILCDVLLIITGVFAAVKIQAFLPALLPFLMWGGVALLLWLAAQALTRAWKGNGGLQVAPQQALSARKTCLVALGISLLNPHVYLDTVVLLGNIGSLQPQPEIFAAGAIVASIFWFSSLVWLAPKLKVWLSSPLRWRIFDGTVAVVLIVIAIKLASIEV